MQKSSRLNLEGIADGDLIILLLAWSLLCSCWLVCQAFLRKLLWLGEKNEAKQVVCATCARWDGGRCLCTSVEPRVDGGCCNRQKGPCQAQPREPRAVRRLETSSNCPLHGLHSLELGYAAWPAWPRLGLVSPAPSLASRSCAVTSELTDSGTDDLQSPSPCVQVWRRLQEVLQLTDALPGF